MQDRFRIRGWNGEGYRYDLQEAEAPLSEYANGWMYELEQCTGLEDKNGKLIYEGDIVNVQEHQDWVNGNYIVEWSYVCHHWNLRSISKDSWGASINFPFSDLNCFNEDSEIVGNIHENPGLLENE